MYTILCEWDAPEGHPEQCCIHLHAFVSYRRLSSQFRFSLSAVALVYLSQWIREMKNISRGPTFGDFVTIHTETSRLQLQDYKSTDSPLPPLLNVMYCGMVSRSIWILFRLEKILWGFLFCWFFGVFLVLADCWKVNLKPCASFYL